MLVHIVSCGYRELSTWSSCGHFQFHLHLEMSNRIEQCLIWWAIVNHKDYHVKIWNPNQDVEGKHYKRSKWKFSPSLSDCRGPPYRVQSISTLGQKGKLSKRPLKGSKHAIIFFNAALPHRSLLPGSSYRKGVRNVPWMWAQWEQSSIITRIFPECQKKTRNVGALRAMLTCKDSEWRGKFEEPWQPRPHLSRGVGHVFLQGRIKVLALSL